MRFISCHDGKLQTLETAGLKASPQRAFATGLAAWDDLAPQPMLARGAVHELLFDAADGPPKFVAAVMGQAASHPLPLPRYSVGEGRGEGARGVEARSTAEDERDRAHDYSTATLTLTLSHGVPRERGSEDQP